MIVRIKFQKFDHMRFLGHLDLLRYFQKSLRRAKFPLEFTKGFHPHPIMSFAQPLSVGVTSTGEYLDVKLCEDIDESEAKNKLNMTMCQGMYISAVKSLPDNTKNVMSLVKAAEYLINISLNGTDVFNMLKIEDFLNQKEIMFTKITKKSEITKDIKEFIYNIEITQLNEDNEYHLPENKYLLIRVKSGSEDNLSPKSVLDLLLDFSKINKDKVSTKIHRVDLFMEKGDKLIPMIEY